MPGTGFRAEKGIRFAVAEKALLDTLYLHLHGRPYSFDIYQDIDISRIDRALLLEWLTRYDNPRFIYQMTFATQTDPFSTEQAAEQPKSYAVQKYRLTYVKENPSFNRIRISSRTDVRDFCRQYLSPLPVENVCIIALDTGNNIIGYEALEGATNQCAVYPTNVFRFLLTSGAASFILAHNHPGGSSHASEADWKLTERLKKAGELLDLPLLDHILITETACISLRDCGRWGRN